MNGDGNYYAENVMKDSTKLTYWCSICSSEPAERNIQVELNGHWVPLMACDECLSKISKEQTDGPVA